MLTRLTSSICSTGISAPPLPRRASTNSLKERCPRVRRRPFAGALLAAVVGLHALQGHWKDPPDLVEECDRALGGVGEYHLPASSRQRWAMGPAIRASRPGSKAQ